MRSRRRKAEMGTTHTQTLQSLLLVIVVIVVVEDPFATTACCFLPLLSSLIMLMMMTGTGDEIVAEQRAHTFARRPPILV